MAKAAKKAKVRKPRIVRVKVAPKDMEKTMRSVITDPDCGIVEFVFEGGYDGKIKATKLVRR